MSFFLIEKLLRTPRYIKIISMGENYEFVKEKKSLSILIEKILIPHIFKIEI